jgi:hypothetical protein
MMTLRSFVSRIFSHLVAARVDGAAGGTRRCQVKNYIAMCHPPLQARPRAAHPDEEALRVHEPHSYARRPRRCTVAADVDSA